MRYGISTVLIAVNTAVFFLSVVISGSLETIDSKTLVSLGASFGPLTVTHEQWWRLVSAMFLHGGMMHILMNMFSLHIVGRGLERFFPWWIFLLLYFASGIVGGLVSLYVHPMSVAVGASGAIFGIFGALSGAIFAHKEKLRHYFEIYMKDFGMVLMLNLAIGLMIPSIDLSAHIGGLITGFSGGFLISRFKRAGILLFVFATAVTIGMTVGWLESTYGTIYF